TWAPTPCRTPPRPSSSTPTTTAMNTSSISTTGLDQYFALSEPLAETSQLGLVDVSGTDVPFESIKSEGFVVGFHVTDVLSADARWHSKLIDLAGNAVSIRDEYPGITLSPTAGDFEAEDPEHFTSDEWSDGVSNDTCSIFVGASTGSSSNSLPAVAGE